jgi:hypothetical protein
VGTDGLLWAGTNAGDTGKGLFTFDGEDFTHITTADGLPDDNAFQVAVAVDGTIWVATDVLYGNPEFALPDEAAGVASFDGTSWTTYTLADGLLSNDGVVAAGPDGTAWVVHGEIAPRGYARFDGTAWTAYPTDPPVGGFRAVVDSDGTLWTASEDGLVRFDGVTKTVYESPFIADLPTPTVDQLAAELGEEVTWEGRGWACTAETTGPLGYGSVLTCRPDPEPVESSWPIVTLLMTGDATWTAAESGLLFPLLHPTARDGMITGPMPRGVNCTDLLAEDSPFSQLGDGLAPEQTYFAVVLHFFLDGQSYLMDIDDNGVPCETLFDPGVVAEVWDGGYLRVPGALG